MASVPSVEAASTVVTVTAAIAGSNSVTHARENAEAGKFVLTDATLQAIEDLIPLGPEFA